MFPWYTCRALLYKGKIATIDGIMKKKWNLIPKQPSCKKKCVSPKKAIVKKRCEIQGGGQEMAVMIV